MESVPPETPRNTLEEGFRDFAESLVQNIDEVFFWKNPDSLTPYFVSNAYEKIWGFPCESAYAVPSTWIESIHPDDRESAIRHMGQAEPFGHNQMEYRIIRPDGEVRWIWVRTFPMKDDAGGSRRVIGIAQDYTERKHAESARSFLSSIVESSDDSIIGSDMEGRIRSWNHGSEKLFGYVRDEVIGKPISILFPCDQQPEYLSTTLRTVQRLEEIKRLETVRIAKGGVPIDVSIILSPIKDNSGEIQGVSGVYRDIRPRKQLEKEREVVELQLEQAVGRYRTLIERSLAGFIRMTMDGRILDCNEACARFFGNA